LSGSNIGALVLTAQQLRCLAELRAGRQPIRIFARSCLKALHRRGFIVPNGAGYELTALGSAAATLARLLDARAVSDGEPKRAA
jgi:hypothetical protein